MTTEIATLYKRGNGGKQLQWTIKVENKDKKVNLFMSYGEVDGAQVIKYQNDIKGKNIGKSNETSPYEQALSLADGKINTKKREGYKDIKELIEENESYYYSGIPLSVFLNTVLPLYNTDINGNEIPMKCQQYYRSNKNFKDKTGKIWDDKKYFFLLNSHEPKTEKDLIINFPCFIQPKINGVRAFVKLVNDKVTIFSKKGLEYNIPQVIDWFSNNKEIFGENRDRIFDGELYIPGHSLQSIASAVKALQLNTALVNYYVFDIAIEDVPQKERFTTLYSQENKNIFNNSLTPPVILIETKQVSADERVQALTDIYISQGYEGSICRDINGLYEFGKRPKTIVKLKRTISKEFEIIGVDRQEVDPSLGLFVCRTDDGKEFKVTPRGTEEYKKLIALKYYDFIGKQLTCVFYEYTEDGIPFHIIDNIVRDYE